MDGLGLEVVTLWGSSFGGPIAATYAARHPDRVDRLVLEGTFARGRDIGTREQRLSNAAIAATLQGDPEPALAAFSYITDPQPTTPHERRIVRVRDSIDLRTLAELYAAAARVDVSDVLRSLDVPTLVLHRRHSRTFRFEAGRAVATLVPGARFASLEGTAHNPWEEHPEEALLALGSFLGDGDALAAALRLDEPDLTAAHSPQPDMVTILFTDLVGSTTITGGLGDARAHALLHEHNAIVRDALRAHGGLEVKHTGDGIMARFSTASRAVASAVEIQRQFEKRNDTQPEVPLSVRIGINVGEPIEEDDDVFGTPVQLAARLCAHAEPGQIVVSNVVRELTAGKGLAFRRLVDANLRGFPEPVRIYAVDR
jgi:class 3 adenylate cyclase